MIKYSGIILEGGYRPKGATAHMYHPYENLNMTFRDLMDLFKTASKGFPDIKVTEKLDGQNIVIGYNPKTGEALAVRNKTQAIAGGLTKDELKRAFTTDRKPGKEAPESVVSSYYEAMENFERVGSVLPEELFYNSQGEVLFFNAEVMDPRSPNVIDYDDQNLVLHRDPIMALKPDGLHIEDPKNTNFRQLEKTLADIQKKQSNFPPVMVNKVIDMTNFIDNAEAHTKAIESLTKVMQGAGLSHQNTIRDYYKNRVVASLSEELGRANFSDNIIDAAVDAVMFYVETNKIPRKTMEVRTVTSLTGSPDEINFLTNFLTSRKVLKEIVQEARKPLEMTIHNFAVDVLEGLESIYMVNAASSTEKLKSKTKEKISSLAASKQKGELPEAEYDVLKKNLQKLVGSSDPRDIDIILSDPQLMGAVDKITSSVEGLVFDFKGKQYKLTGTFAPVNQILGLGRYSRGGDSVNEAEEEVDWDDYPEPTWGLTPQDNLGQRRKFDNVMEVEEEDLNRKIAVFPGKFKPPQKGHLDLAQCMLDQGVDHLYILISPLAKKVGEKEITVGHSKAVWDLYLRHLNISDKVSVIDSPYNSPVQASYAVMDGDVPGFIPKPGDVIIPVASDKPDPKSGKPDYSRFAKYHMYKPKLPGVTPANVQNYVVCALEDDEGAINATEFRQALEFGYDISRFIPKGINPDDVRMKLGFDPQEKKKEDAIPSPFHKQLSTSVYESIFDMIENVLTEGDFQPTAKKRTSKAHKGFLDQGRHDLTKHGAPFNQSRPVDNSNAFLAKESNEISESLKQKALIGLMAIVPTMAKAEPDSIERLLNKVDSQTLVKYNNLLYKDLKNDNVKGAYAKINKLLKFPIQPTTYTVPGTDKRIPGILFKGEMDESAMSAGAVEGHAGSFVGFTDKDNEKHRRDTKK